MNALSRDVHPQSGAHLSPSSKVVQPIPGLDHLLSCVHGCVFDSGRDGRRLGRAGECQRAYSLCPKQKPDRAGRVPGGGREEEGRMHGASWPSQLGHGKSLMNPKVAISFDVLQKICVRGPSNKFCPGSHSAHTGWLAGLHAGWAGLAIVAGAAVRWDLLVSTAAQHPGRGVASGRCRKKWLVSARCDVFKNKIKNLVLPHSVASWAFC